MEAHPFPKNQTTGSGEGKRTWKHFLDKQVSNNAKQYWVLTVGELLAERDEKWHQHVHRHDGQQAQARHAASARCGTGEEAWENIRE